MDLELTDEFQPLMEMVWWEDIKKFLLEAFKGFQVTERQSDFNFDEREEITAWSHTGKSKLVWGPIIEPEINQPGMFWKCTCYKLDVYIDTKTGRPNYLEEEMWEIDNVPRKTIPVPTVDLDTKAVIINHTLTINESDTNGLSAWNENLPF